MSIDLLKRAGLFIVFALAQTIVLGRIHLFGYATPLLYVYFVLLFPRNYPKWAILLWSFFLGLTVDVFFNTPGVAAASMTLVGAIQPYFFELFVPRDSSENLQPSVKTLGTLKYLNYSVVLVVLYCLVFFSLEVFNYYNWVEWLKCVVGSAVFTLVLIWTFDSVAGKQG
jgi:rod shape-determining protein MreD